MNTVEIKLVINGKEAIATLQLTDDNVQKMADHLDQMGKRGATSVDLIRQRYQTLVALMESQPLGSKEFEELSVMTASARKELDAAEAMMQKATGTTGNARMAVTSFSQTLSDSTQFQNGFRYGMMAISNNLEQMFGALGRVKEESAATGQSMSKTLIAALSGPGGVMIALSSVMVLLQILPGLLEENEQKVEDFSVKNLENAVALNENAEAIRKVTDELKSMGESEIIDSIITIENQIALSSDRSLKYLESWMGTLKSFLNGRYGMNFDVTGGEGEQAVLLEKSKKAAEEELANRSRVKILEDEINALKEAQNKKGVDLRENLAQIEAKERERTQLLKSDNELLKEQAEETIRLQRSQVDAMVDGYEKQRAAANVAFEDAKAGLQEELNEKKISQYQYTELLKLEETKRNNELSKIEAERHSRTIDARADALRRMSAMDASELLSKLNLDERIALSKATTEEERLRITKEFAIRRVEAEAAAQQAILEIERQAIMAKMANAPVGSKERESLVIGLDANDDAVEKVLRELQLKKTEITVGFNIDNDSLAGLDTIAGVERKISEEQQALAKATTDQQRDAIRQRIEDHKAALIQMSYSEDQFRRDVYTGMKDLFSQVTQLINQNIQQDADTKLQQLDTTYQVRDERIRADQEAALNKLQAEQDQVLAEAKSSAQRTAINKNYTEQKKKKKKQYAAAAAESERSKEAAARQIKLEAFEAQKKLSYLTATINIAEGITRILATVPPPFNVPLIAMTAASGAIQLAAIANSKPGFKDGGVFRSDGLVRGPGGPEDDAVNARLSDGEFVVNARSTSLYLDLLKAINSGGPAARMAAGGRYDRLRAAERSLAIKLPSASIPSSLSMAAQPIDTSRIETKLEQGVQAIKDMAIMVNIDGEKVTAVVEKQQKLDKEKTY